jgi:hypothetical protein
MIKSLNDWTEATLPVPKSDYGNQLGPFLTSSICAWNVLKALKVDIEVQGFERQNIA